MRTHSLARWWRWGVVVLVALGSCSDEQAGPKTRGPAAPPTPQARMLGSAPSDLTFRSGATWADGTIRFLGAKVAPANAQPGQPVTVSYYFEALKPPPQGWQLFVHVVDASSGAMLANADHAIQGGAMPLEKWPVGQVVEDSQTLVVPQGAGSARLMIGFWQGDARLPVDQPQAHDGSHRMYGPFLTAGQKMPELPEYVVAKTATAPKIDGVLDDAAWKKATPVTLVTSFDGHKATLPTVARLLYDDKNLYVAFDCEDPDVWGTLTKRDDPIYTQEVVEIFLDADADGRTYNELEVSPNNTIFDAYFPARREGMDTSWDSQMETAVKVRGTVNNPDDRDDGWSVEMRIPFDRLASVPHLPPKPQDRWRFNLYRLEHLGRRQIEGQAFSPLFMGDFHNLPRFGWLVFGSP